MEMLFVLVIVAAIIIVVHISPFPIRYLYSSIATKTVAIIAMK